MFGTLPAYGIYLRHVKGLTFEDVTLETTAPDLRPALVGEDVEDLELANFRAAGAARLRCCACGMHARSTCTAAARWVMSPCS